jgi:hypothetical protein
MCVCVWGLPTDLTKYGFYQREEGGDHARPRDLVMLDGDVERIVREGGVGDGRGGRGEVCGSEGLWGGIGVIFEERPLTTGLFGRKKDGGGVVKEKGWERDWGLVVDALVEAGPAALSRQIVPGDVLEKVDGIPVLDLPIAQVP